MTNMDLIIGCAAHQVHNKCCYPCRYDSVCERFISAYDFTPTAVLPYIEAKLNKNREAFLEWGDREVGK